MAQRREKQKVVWIDPDNYARLLKLKRRFPRFSLGSLANEALPAGIDALAKKFGVKGL